MQTTAPGLVDQAAHTEPADGPALLSVRAVHKNFGKHAVLKGVSLDVAEGEFLTILGESGSGKTTLLRLVAGFEHPDAGEIWMAGERLDTLPPFRRRVNTVFQQYALFPHLSVFDNVAYGLRVGKVGKSEVSARVEQALAMVKMSGFASAPPAKISGGQQQRVALARALINKPSVVLADEPTGNLDSKNSDVVLAMLRKSNQELGQTVLMITHNPQAAEYGDRIIHMRDGQIVNPEEDPQWVRH